MNKEYYYHDGNKQKGPLNASQLKSLGLKPDTLIWSEGFEDWKPLREVKELQVGGNVSKIKMNSTNKILLCCVILCGAILIYFGISACGKASVAGSGGSNGKIPDGTYECDYGGKASVIFSGKKVTIPSERVFDINYGEYTYTTKDDVLILYSESWSYNYKYIVDGNTLIIYGRYNGNTFSLTGTVFTKK
jgi:hypothetical protein